MALTPVQKLKKAGEEQHKAFLKTAEGQSLAKREQLRLEQQAIQNPKGVQERIKQMQQQAEDSAAAQRPPTPPPTFIGDLNQPTTEEDPLNGAMKTIFKQWFGDMFTDDQLNAMIANATDFSKTISTLEGGQQTVLGELASQTQQAKTDLETERTRLDKLREQRIKSLEQERQAFTESQLGTARRQAQETTSIEERLLGGRGNLTTTVGATRLGGIQEQLAQTENLVRSRAKAQFDMQRAELEGADAATIERMQGNINKMISAENTARLQAAETLAGAKLQAQQAGDQARLGMIQSVLDNLSTQKLAAEVDTGVTQQVNDGFLYDATGNKIVDAEGNHVQYQSQEELDDLMKLGAGDVVFDPNTGEIVTSVPGDTKRRTSVIDGRVVDLDTGQVIFEDGGMAAGTQTLAEQPKVLDAINKMESIDELLVHEGMAGSVGPYAISRWTPFSVDKAERQDFAAGVMQLISQETMDTLVGLKERGGTLGALSDSERKMLEQTASKIGGWIQRDKNGNPTGKFEVSEEDFKKELSRIHKITDTVLRRAAGLPTDTQVASTQTLMAYADASNAIGRRLSRDEYEELIKMNLAEETWADLQKIQLPFSQDLSMSGNGSADKIASAIGQFESGGNYNARGPVVTSGQYKGERAMGKYQIMPGNLPSWSKAALGREVSVEEFMNNPQLQDSIASHKMEEIFNKYGSVEDVASIWFSGQPLARAGTAKDVLGTTVPSYVSGVVSIFNKLG
jgi:hypothetical protein